MPCDHTPAKWESLETVPFLRIRTRRIRGVVAYIISRQHHYGSQPRETCARVRGKEKLGFTWLKHTESPAGRAWRCYECGYITYVPREHLIYKIPTTPRMYIADRLLTCLSAVVTCEAFGTVYAAYRSFSPFLRP